MSASVTVTRRTMLISRTARRPLTWLYEAVGPDGRRFDNRSIVDLRRVLRGRYGRDVQIIEEWKT